MKYLLMVLLVILPSASSADECKLDWHSYCNQGQQAFPMPEDRRITSVIEAARGPELKEIIPDGLVEMDIECHSPSYLDDDAAVAEIRRLIGDNQHLELTGLFYGAAAPHTAIVVRHSNGIRLILASGFRDLFCIIDKEDRRWYSSYSS